MRRTTWAVGALMALLGRALSGASVCTLSDTLRAVGSGSVTRYTESGSTNYYLGTGDVRYGQWYSVYPQASGHQHGTIPFDLGPIPDTALVVGAEIGFFQYSDDTAGTPPYYVRAHDYAGANAESLFNAVDTADTASSLLEAHHGWNRVLLTADAAQWIQARLPSDDCRLAIAEDAWGELGDAHGYTAAESLRPYLLVNYLPAAASEPTMPGPPGPTLDIAPNPCHGSTTIRLRDPLAIRHHSSLSICNAAGSLVFWRPVRESSSVIRTSAFSAGVYVVRWTSSSRAARTRPVVVYQ